MIVLLFVFFCFFPQAMCLYVHMCNIYVIILILFIPLISFCVSAISKIACVTLKQSLSPWFSYELEIKPLCFLTLTFISPHLHVGMTSYRTFPNTFQYCGHACDLTAAAVRIPLTFFMCLC